MFHVKRFDPREDVHKENNNNDDDDVDASVSSSSVPSSSSDESSDDDESVSGVSPVAVIAPEQPHVADASKRQRNDYLKDEAMDDLLGFDEIISDAPAPTNIQNALKYASMSINEAARCWKLPEFLIKNLKEDNYLNFFPIQSLVIPDVIASERHSHLLQCRDGKNILM